ncbi:nucleotidyltransferase family protein [Nocardia uniformis]|uniref:Nucleotidyltransferase family protein n=1 Tax=Nocardia uniformis TaxID=53432 RepID=A0A849C7R4_9NOCA|nr:nucleotidyltransferase family protein [Nocardia uniformis]NNH74813.1 nucleotidyltransferase family protein [Nocardia uniformis]
MTLRGCDGILLAAGAGTRYGHPKVLAEGGDWLRSAVGALRDGGCERVYVVLGATGPAYRRTPDSDSESASGTGPEWQVSQTHSILIPAGVQPVWASDWKTGMGASLRAGLAAVIGGPAIRRGRVAADGIDASQGLPKNRPPSCESAMTGGKGGLPEFVAIMPVDTPDVDARVVARVLAAARETESGLARAFFDDKPGHPVMFGRQHWAGVYAHLSGMEGAVSYLRGRADMVCVTCDDVATGQDHDYPRHSHTPSGSK